MLQDGDIWLSEREATNGKPYHGLYCLKVRVWRGGAWRDRGVSWKLTDLVEENTNRGLIKIENRPKHAIYTGIYRYSR
jgi:hypothetical protein